MTWASTDGYRRPAERDAGAHGGHTGPRVGRRCTDWRRGSPWSERRPRWPSLRPGGPGGQRADLAVVLGVRPGRACPLRLAAGLRWATKRFPAPRRRAARACSSASGRCSGWGRDSARGGRHRAGGVLRNAADRAGAGGRPRAWGSWSPPGSRSAARPPSRPWTASPTTTSGTWQRRSRSRTLYGSAAIGLVPLLGDLIRLRPEQLGAWAGVCVHEVAQVVAAASPAGAHGRRDRRRRQADAGRPAGPDGRPG